MSKAKDDALYQLNVQRETWCRVEADSKFWAQAERRHFACHLQTTCGFKSLHAQRADQRSSWIGGIATLPERKHFAENRSLEIHREVFSTTEGDEMPTIPGDVARNRLPLKRAVVEMELSSAYVVPTKRPPTASSAEELE